MIIDCISDLHGYYPELEGGDLLIVAGDLTSSHTEKEHFQFNEWLENQKYKKIILISGNHDTWIEQNECAGFADFDGQKVEHICDSGTEFKGLKIWGSPWTKTFEGMNPHCKAFTCETEDQMYAKFVQIPSDTDILITHSPPYGIFDHCQNENVGDLTLRNIVLSKERLPNLKLHIFGHIHECGGREADLISCKFVNASYVNEEYQPVNKPIRVIL